MVQYILSITITKVRNNNKECFVFHIYIVHISRSKYFLVHLACPPSPK